MNETSPSPSAKRFRKLRIAFSVICGIICLLLIALWVRSYEGWLIGRGEIRTIGYFGFYCALGEFDCGFAPPSNPRTPFELRWISGEVISPAEVFDFSNTFMGFELHPNGAGATFPLWFPVLLSASLAALPRLRWRFSLRTLLTAMTLVAVILGAIVYAVK